MSKLPITLCGSISHHPGPLGSIIHRAGYAALGLDYTYVPFKVTDLRGALQGMRALGIRGFGVSMPFKIEILQHLDHVDPLAQRIGAVNTVVNNDGILTGYNADAHGAAEALAQFTELSGKRVLLIGAGGAARAVAHGLRDRGASLHLVNRSPLAAQEIASSVEGTAGDLTSLQSLDGFDILVHTTPIGMADHPGIILPAEWLRSDLVVFDAVYKPIETELTREAKARGATIVHGGLMLLHQAFRQFELYTGYPAPREAMTRAMQAALGG
jgi:shikimate dehydrogenase